MGRRCEHPEDRRTNFGGPHPGQGVQWCHQCGALRHEALRNSRERPYFDWVDWIDPEPVPTSLVDDAPEWDPALIRAYVVRSAEATLSIAESVALIAQRYSAQREELLHAVAVDLRAALRHVDDEPQRAASKVACALSNLEQFAGRELAPESEDGT